MHREMDACPLSMCMRFLVYVLSCPAQGVHGMLAVSIPNAHGQTDIFRIKTARIDVDEYPPLY